MSREYPRFVRISLTRPRISMVGLFARPPWREGRAQQIESRVQLYRPSPYSGRLVPAPMLHRAGYVATPIRVAPLCAGSGRGPHGDRHGGPYGRIVYIRADSPPALKACPHCDHVWSAKAGRR